MWLTRVSIRNPYLAAMVMLAITVLGLFAYNRLSVEEFPDIRFPIAVISTVYTGASPTVVESEVTRPIEEVVNTVSGVKHIRSYSFEGSSTVVVEFELSVDPVTALQDVRDKVSSIAGRFRREIDPPTVSQVDPNDNPVMTLAVSSTSADATTLSTLADQLIKKRLQQVIGVGSVNVIGQIKREIRIDLDPDRLRTFGLAASDVVDALAGDNKDVPAGRVTERGQDVSVRLDGKLRQVDDFNRVIITSRNGRAITLGDVATVRDGSADYQNLALINGKRALSIELTAARGANVVATADGVNKALTALRPQLPPGTEIKVLSNTAEQVRRSLANVRSTLIEGAILTVIIVWLFLGSWRSTVITGLTLPISLIGTLFAVAVSGFTLNVMTLMALSLSIGLLIDDAIVVRENIVRHANMGKDHYRAALEGTEEIGLAVLATTLTVVAVFLPVGFMSGIIGKFFQQFGLTVAVAVMISLFVSFTLDPMLSSVWPDPHHHGDKHRGGIIGRMLDWFENSLDRLSARYGAAIGWSLEHRKTTLAAALALLVGSFLLVPVIGAEFVPKSDNDRFSISIKTAPGATLEYTEAKARDIETRLRKYPEVRDVYINVGGGFGEGRNQATLRVYTSPKHERKRSIFDLFPLVRADVQQIGGVQLENVAEEGGPGGGQKPVRIGVRGGDFSVLERVAGHLAERIAAVPNVTDVESSVQDRNPSYNYQVDRQAASTLGIDPARIGNTLAVLFSGQIATTWEAPDGENYDVRVQIPEARRDTALLDTLTVAATRRTDDGNAHMVPLSAVATRVPGTTPQRVERYDQAREVTVTANIIGGDAQAAYSAIQTILADTRLPAGYYTDFGGTQQDMADSFGYALQALAIGVIFIYMILCAQFRSFLQPVAIMMSLPLAFVGVFIALLLWRSTLNMFSVIGVIMLMGLAAKNGILLVDFINHARREGMDKVAAIREAGRVRLRPILMTSFAMIFGMLPLALAVDAGSEVRAPMAHAVIGGMVTSTLLTLIVVPVVYFYLDSLGAWVAGKLGGRRKQKAA